MRLKLSLAQMNCVENNFEVNFEKGCEWIVRAASENCQLILFPELWTSGFDLPHCPEHVTENLEYLPRLQKLADFHGISIGGSYLMGTNGNVFNTFLLFSPGRSEPATYQKIHLFKQMNEEKWLQPGSRRQAADSPWGKTGLAICYDLRFPELFRSYVDDEVKIILLPAVWPARRIDHFRTLIKARAIENQCFLAGCNAAGASNGEPLGGQSALIDPWGTLLIEGPSDGEALLCAEIDLALVDEVRTKMPFLHDRRPEAYQ